VTQAVTGPGVRPEVCVGAVVIDADRLLMVRRGHPPAFGEWSVPGGRVEAGETLAEAVVREVAEETGLEIVCGELVGWVERIGPGYPFVILDFPAPPRDDRPPTAGTDAAEVEWVPLTELTDRPVVDGLVEFLHAHAIIDTIA
jgi:ADP-ribose pyrophosphatase YjhB (NUDIX family)